MPLHSDILLENLSFMDVVSFEDFKRLDIRIGKVLKAEKVEGADKLLKLQVDFGSAEQNSEEKDSKNLALKEQRKLERVARQVVSGIVEFYITEELVGKEFVFLVNLEPRKFKGVESQGMILAADDDGKPVLLRPDKKVSEGSIVK